MPRFEPFRALRYAGLRASHTAPPYDVLNERERAAFAESDPCNVVHVDMPRAEQPYRSAADTMDGWRRDGVLVADERPSLTLYRMRFTDDVGRRRETVGVIGALEVVDEGAGGVLPHERTTPKDKTDRLDLTRATTTNLSCVWGLSLATGLTGELEQAAEPLGDFLDESGVHHAVERVDDPDRIARIATLVGGADVLIADGHHRYAVARTFRDETRGTTLEHAASTTMAYVGELVEEQLSIAAIHRLYRGSTPDALLETLGASFDVSDPLPLPENLLDLMQREGRLAFLTSSDTMRFLTPRPEAFIGCRDLDSVRLEQALTGTTVETAYQHGLAHVRERVASGEFAAAILIRPTSIEEIRRTAAEGLLMPPKSTFFTPKLRTGLVFRDLRLG